MTFRCQEWCRVDGFKSHIIPFHPYSCWILRKLLRTPVWPSSSENTFLSVFTIATILTVFYKFTATMMIHCKHLSKLFLSVLSVYKTAEFTPEQTPVFFWVPLNFINSNNLTNGKTHFFHVLTSLKSGGVRLHSLSARRRLWHSCNYL